MAGHDNKLMYVIYGAALIKGIKASQFFLCPILLSAITIMYLKVKTVRNENVRLVLSKDGDSEVSMMTESQINGQWEANSFFYLPKNHKITTECFVKEKVVDELMGYYKHFA